MAEQANSRDRLLADDDDFPGIVMKGPAEDARSSIYAMWFWNRETPKDSRKEKLQWIWMLTTGALLLLNIFIFETVPADASMVKFWSVILSLIVFGVTAARTGAPETVRRFIAANFDTMQLMIGRETRKKPVVEQSYKFGPDLKFTVEEDPNAAVARQKRQELAAQQRPGQHNPNLAKLSEAEQTHCLFGWFGTNANTPILLISRYEPLKKNQGHAHSLNQVREAVVWMLTEGAHDFARRQTGAGDTAFEPPLT